MTLDGSGAAEFCALLRARLPDLARRGGFLSRQLRRIRAAILLRDVALAVDAQRDDFHVSFGGGCRGRFPFMPRFNQPTVCKPASTPEISSRPAEILLRRVQEDVQALGVNLSHAAEMTAEVSCGDEIGEDGLFHERGVAAGDGERGGNAIERGPTAATRYPRRSEGKRTLLKLPVKRTRPWRSRPWRAGTGRPE